MPQLLLRLRTEECVCGMADEAPIEAVAEVVVDRVIPVGPIDEAIEEVIKVGVNDVAWSFNLSLESETF